jgi:hypothetical protein
MKFLTTSLFLFSISLSADPIILNCGAGTYLIYPEERKVTHMFDGEKEQITRDYDLRISPNHYKWVPSPSVRSSLNRYTLVLTETIMPSKATLKFQCEVRPGKI